MVAKHPVGVARIMDDSLHTKNDLLATQASIGNIFTPHLKQHLTCPSQCLVSTSLTYKVTSKQVTVPGTSSKDIKLDHRSQLDVTVCINCGRILAE